jgi:beta-barrel assembly-enhancing protease
MNKPINRKSMWRAAVVFSGLTVTFVTIPIACKQDGSGGGGGLGGLSNVFKPVASAVGGAAGVDSRITDTALAAAEFWKDVNVNADQEDGMGQSVAVSMTNTYPLTKDEKLNKYVSLVGLTIVNASDRPVGNWQFGVLETPDVNAFAGPNGYIFVTRGALNRMENEAQLAGVLAHEVTHVLHHHGLEGVKTNAKADFAKNMVSIHVKDPTGTGLVKSMAVPMVTTIAKNGYGQGQENDADATAIKLMVAAGYDPNGLPQFLEKLQSAGGGPFSTHPGQPERIKKTRAQIAQLGSPNKGKTLKERFAKNVGAAR